MLVYASMEKRFVAVFLDGILLLSIIFIFLVPVYIFRFYTMSHYEIIPGGGPAVRTIPRLPIGMIVYSDVVKYIFSPAYDIFFIGKYGATLGKMLMKIKVVTADGGRVSYWRATGRHFAKILSAIILFIGYFMAFWDDEKRALHDRLCKTRVVNNAPC